MHQRLKEENEKSKLNFDILLRIRKGQDEIRDENDQQQIGLVYDQKKRNLDENKNKRIETMQSKLEDIKNEIQKKKNENLEFSIKLQNLNENVSLKEQIINLDLDERDSGDEK